MKKALFPLLLVAFLPLFVYAQALAGPRAYEGMKLVWHDEFDQPGAPDPDRWQFEHGFVRNQELQWYQPQNARVCGGVLQITGRRERVKNPAYQPDKEVERSPPSDIPTMENPTPEGPILENPAQLSIDRTCAWLKARAKT